LLIDNLGSGGAQRQITLLAIQLSNLGCNVTLLTYNEHKHMDYMLKGYAVNNISLKTDGFTKVRKLYSVLFYLWSVKPDVIISYLDAPNFIAGIYKVFNKQLNWIASERNLNKGAGIQVYWRKVLYKFSNKVVCNSFAQQDWLLKNKILNSDKSCVIWNSVFDDFWNVQNKKNLATINFISLGRLSYQKYPELLIQAIKLIDINNCHFTWFGEDDPDSPGKRELLLSQISDENLPVSIYKSSSEPHKLLESSNCLILTSRFEGTPNVVLEAMAAGVFIIAPNIVDLPIILENRVRGLLFKSESSQSLAAAITEYLSLSNDERNVIIKNANDYARVNFRCEDLGFKYLDLINNE
jgi:glycosyltransferase involved in cell wall biosynthesis